MEGVKKVLKILVFNVLLIITIGLIIGICFYSTSIKKQVEPSAPVVSKFQLGDLVSARSTETVFSGKVIGIAILENNMKYEIQTNTRTENVENTATTKPYKSSMFFDEHEITLIERSLTPGPGYISLPPKYKKETSK